MSTTSAIPVATHPLGGWGALGYRYRWMVLAVVLIADVMDLLDSTIANLAGPSIRRDLGGGDTTLQWILAAYTLTFAIGLVTSARAGDLIGRKQMFVTGMIGFTAASLCCGLAPSVGLLIAARIAQGLFGAVMIPQGLAMVKSSFRPEDLQKAFIPFGPVMGLAAVLGPIIAGVLLQADVFGTGWRMVFLINVPIGLVASALAWRYLPAMHTEGATARLDPLGTTLLTVASAMLIYPLVQGHELGWPAWTFALMAGSMLVFALFVRNERRSCDPVIEPTLFTHRGFVSGLLFLTTFFVAMSGLMLVVNLYLQLGLRMSPLHTGLTMSPWALGIALGAVASGAVLGPRFGRKILHAGLLVLGVGMVLLWWTIGHFGLVITGWELAPATLVAGIGSGFIFAPLFDLILADLNEREVGTGSGLLNAVQQFGGAVGVATLGTLFFGLISQHGFVVATQVVLWASLGCYALAFGAAFLLPKRARTDVVPH